MRSGSPTGLPKEVKRSPDWIRPCWRITASMYARTRWLPPTVTLTTIRYAAVFGDTDGKGIFFADTTVIFWPCPAESRMMSPRQVVVWLVEPRLHDAFASRSVRYTWAVEPTVTRHRPAGPGGSPATRRLRSP